MVTMKLSCSKCSRGACFQGSSPSPPGNLKTVAASCYLPKKRMLYPQGDDAHFICNEKSTIGVADGVGSWITEGIDPGAYARRLMSICKSEVQRQKPGGCIDLKLVLDTAFNRTFLRGSCTACLITLVDNNHLQVVNVGDSGFVLIRKGSDVYRSPIQEHEFNCPYQLGRKARGSSTPVSAQTYKVEVKEGDLIVAGTDGLFDNMFVQQIKSMAKAGLKRGDGLREIAAALALQARKNSLQTDVRTPFSDRARRHGKELIGGKPDDITVVVGYICRC